MVQFIQFRSTVVLFQQNNVRPHTTGGVGVKVILKMALKFTSQPAVQIQL